MLVNKVMPDSKKVGYDSSITDALPECGNLAAEDLHVVPHDLQVNLCTFEVRVRISICFISIHESLKALLHLWH